MPCCNGGRSDSRAFLDRAHVFFIFLIKKIDLSLIGVYMTVTSVSGRIYAVKEINAALYPSKIFAGVPTPIR